MCNVQFPQMKRINNPILGHCPLCWQSISKWAGRPLPLYGSTKWQHVLLQVHGHISTVPIKCLLASSIAQEDISYFFYKLFSDKHINVKADFFQLIAKSCS